MHVISINYSSWHVTSKVRTVMYVLEDEVDGGESVTGNYTPISQLPTL